MKTVAPFEIGLVVADIDHLLPFYRDVLGLDVIGDIEMSAERSSTSRLAPDGYRVVRLESRWGGRLKLARPARGHDVPPASADYAMHRVGAAYVTFGRQLTDAEITGYIQLFQLAVNRAVS